MQVSCTGTGHLYNDHLENLDDFSLIGIFDSVDLKDLINIALSSRRFEDIISKYYITRKYRLNERKIQIIVTATAEISVDTQSTKIASGLNETLQVLEMFGHAFYHLDIRFYSFGSQISEQISKYLKKYCSHAFQKATIHTVVNMKKPFILPHIDSLTVNNINTNVAPIQFNVQFSNIQSLAVHFPRDLASIQFHFAHLVDFSLGIRANGQISGFLWDFLRLNPQIRTFHTPLFKDHTYFERLNEALVNLTTLTVINSGISRNPTDQPIVCFQNVREFILDVHFYYSFAIGDALPLIGFEQLETFKLHGNSIEAIEGLFGFFKENPTLSRLDLGEWVMNYEHLREIVEIMDNLKEITVAVTTIEVIDEFRNYLMDDDSSIHLEKVFVKTTQDIRERILDSLPCTWQMVGEFPEDPKIILLFRRI